MFKHSMTLTGSAEHKSEFIEEIIKIGWQRPNLWPKLAGEPDLNICTICLGRPKGYETLAPLYQDVYIKSLFPMEREFSFNLDDPDEFDAALAIAGITGQEWAKVGDYVVITNEFPEGDKDLAPGPPADGVVGKLIKTEVGIITFPHLVQVRAGEIPRAPKFRRPFNIGVHSVRPAAAEEIINQFIKKKQMITTSANTQSSTPPEVTTYRTKRDLVAIVAGAFLPIKSGEIFQSGSQVGIYFSPWLGDRTSFEPVQNEIEETMTIGNQNLVVKIGRGYIKTFANGAEKNIKSEDLGSVVTFMKGVMDDFIGGLTLGGHGVGIEVPQDQRCILIGCIDSDYRFSLSELKELLDTYSRINGCDNED